MDQEYHVELAIESLVGTLLSSCFIGLDLSLSSNFLGTELMKRDLIWQLPIGVFALYIFGMRIWWYQVSRLLRCIFLQDYATLVSCPFPTQSFPFYCFSNVQCFRFPFLSSSSRYSQSFLLGTTFGSYQQSSSVAPSSFLGVIFYWLFARL